MSLFADFFHILLNIDYFLPKWAIEYGVWVYAIVFLIIFCETGLVIFPFLPGDSFLFLIGTLCGSAIMDPWISFLVIFFGALCGDTVNFLVGRFFRGRLSPDNRLISQKNIQKTEKFFDKHGGKSLILARFVPIIRTYAPFVGGLVNMPYKRFISFNVFGAFIWPVVFLSAGYFFGQFTFITQNIGKFVLFIVIFTLLSFAWGYLKKK